MKCNKEYFNIFKSLMNKNWGKITLLMVIAGVIGVYHLVTTVLIEKDAVFYIEFAQSFHDGFGRALEDNRFGYPLMLYFAQSLYEMFFEIDSVQEVLNVSQIFTFMFRLASIIPLFYLGKRFIGADKTFIALLVLIFLPYPAKYGANVLRDWPFFLFFVSSLLFMIKGFEDGKLWLFVVFGIICGLGFFIRPEALQLIIYFYAFFVFNLFTGKFKLTKAKTVLAGIVMSIVFISPIFIYQVNNGSALPSKLESLLESKFEFVNSGKFQELKETTAAERLVEAAIELNERLFENTAWSFFPFAVLGFFDIYNRKKNYNTTIKLFFSVLVPLNIIIFLLLYIKFGYIDRRHIMTFSLMLCFLIPSGLDVVGMYMDKVYRLKQIDGSKLLLITGLIVCVVRFAKPIEYDKTHYVKAINWVSENVEQNELIAVDDPRIGYLSGREYITVWDDILSSGHEIVVETDSKRDVKGYKLLTSFENENRPEKEVRIYRKIK